MIVAPPLLALGAPSTLLLQTSSRRTKTQWLKVLHSRPFALLTHPAVVWCLYFGLMFAFFLTHLINVAMENMWLMDIMNLLFFFSGTLYWWPMVGIDPIVHWKMGYGAKMVNVVLGAAPEVILGLAILSSRAPIASMYTLASTRAGGGLLWASTEVATFIGMVPVFVQWMRADDRAGREPTRRAARSPAGLTTAGLTTAALRHCGPQASGTGPGRRTSGIDLAPWPRGQTVVPTRELELGGHVEGQSRFRPRTPSRGPHPV